jgi:hypothetical protein
MEKCNFVELRQGDVIRHVRSGETYVVEKNLGSGRIVATKTVLLINPNNWIIVSLGDANEPQRFVETERA